MASPAAFAKTVVTDFVMTVLWAMIVSTSGYLLSLLSFVHNGDDTIEILLVVSVVIFQLILFAGMTEALGGASFNPLVNISNFAGGVGNETLLSLLLRIPAQSVGMQLGAWVTWHHLVPHTHHHTLEGPSLKPGINVQVGATAEFLLVFLLNTLVLYVMFARDFSLPVKGAILLPSTILAIVMGAAYTGPSMNPLFAFSWAYHHNRHSNLEHFLVYWMAPIAGAVLAGLVFKWFLKPKDKAVTMKEMEKKAI